MPDEIWGGADMLYTFDYKEDQPGSYLKEHAVGRNFSVATIIAALQVAAQKSPDIAARGALIEFERELINTSVR